MEAFQSNKPPCTVGQDQIEPELDVVYPLFLRARSIRAVTYLVISIDPPSWSYWVFCGCMSKPNVCLFIPQLPCSLWLSTTQ